MCAYVLYIRVDVRERYLFRCIFHALHTHEITHTFTGHNTTKNGKNPFFKCYTDLEVLISY